MYAGSAAKFKSKLHAAQQAKRVWVCSECDRWHHTKQIECKGCGCLELLYFQSHGEARRWGTLRMLQQFGKVTELRRQVPFPVYVNGRAVSAEKLGKPLFTYRADFVYRRDGREIVEDYKGDARGAMDEFLVKRKIIQACYDIKVTISEG